MARKNRHNAAFVVGAVVGGLAGAAAALWKTPYSGAELRAQLGGGPNGHAGGGTVAAGRLPEPTMMERVISTAENLLAPIVGVELGKTANGSGQATVSSTERLQPTETMGPGVGVRPDVDLPGSGRTAETEPPAAPDENTGLVERDLTTGGKTNVTPVDDTAEVPDPAPTGSPAPESEAATLEELTTPQTKSVPDALKHEHHDLQPFPKLGGTEEEKA